MKQPSSLSRRVKGFSLVEAIVVIAIIGVMSTLVVSAISNASLDAQRIVSRQQQATVQNAVQNWAMSQTRDPLTGQLRSISDVRATYNAAGSTKGRFDLLRPGAGGSGGYIDDATLAHFDEYTASATDRLISGALKSSQQYLQLPAWAAGSFPKVDLKP